MTDETQDLLRDLARAKAIFQQRALLAVLNEGQRHPPVMAASSPATHSASGPDPIGRGMSPRCA
jgi:hypothetical protein